MTTAFCLFLNAFGAGLCVGACWLSVTADHVTMTGGCLITAGICCTLAGVVGLAIAEPEVWA